MSPPDINSSITGKFPSLSHPLEQRLPTHPSRHLLHQGECYSRTWLQTSLNSMSIPCQLPSPLNHSCLCCWLWGLSSPLKLGKACGCGQQGGTNISILQMRLRFRDANWLAQDHTTTKWESSASAPSLPRFQTCALHHHLRLRVPVTCHIFTTY